MSTAPSSPGMILVGLDDSAAARAALAWAVAYARSTSTVLHALHVFEPAEPQTWTPRLQTTSHALPTGSRARSRATLQTVFDAEAPEPGWSLLFADGSAGQQLVGHAEAASLLVVGTQEHTGIERLLLGSVSHYCLTRAGCPVVGVPGRPSSSVVAAAAGASGDALVATP